MTIMQRFVYFNPVSQTIGLYRESGAGFRRSFTISVADLDPMQQGTVEASMAWLQSQLAVGEMLTLVIFEPYVPAVLEEGEEPVLALRASITGRSATGGERTIGIDSADVPGEVALGLIGLWTELAAIPIP